MNGLIASDVSVSAYVDQNKIGLNDIFQLYIEISASDISNIEQPLLPNIPFENLGVSQSSSTSISIINGKMTSVKKKTYIYSLQPQKKGTFNIPSISVKAEGKIFKTNGIQIIVNEGSSQRQNPTPNRPQASQFKTSDRINEEDIVFVAEPSKRSVYKNESFIVDYTLYTRYNLQLDRLGEEPVFNGFWKEDISGDGNIKMIETTWQGKKYYALHIRKLILSANKAGNLQIPSLTLFADVALPATGFFGFSQSKSITLKSKPVNIAVSDLPKVPTGLNFSGAVGQFDINTKLNPKTVKAGETATLTITISGTGNLNQMNNPEFPPVTNLKVLGPESENKKDGNKANQITRIFRYAFLPQDEGLYSIPAIEFIYFDPVQKKYVNKTSPEYKLQAERGNIVLTTTNNQKIISSEGSDIGFIVTDLNFIDFPVLFKSGIYWLAILLLVLSIPAHYFYKLEQDKLSSNLDYLRHRKASSILKKYLKDASFAYKHQQDNQFYDSSYKGILQYLTDKLAIARGSTKNEIFDTLKQHLDNEQLYIQLNHFMDKCTQFKYMPGTEGQNDLREDYQHLKNLVNELTKHIK